MAARAELAVAESEHDEMRLAHAHAALAELNEGAIAAAAQAVMHGLGFAASDGARPVTRVLRRLAQPAGAGAGAAAPGRSAAARRTDQPSRSRLRRLARVLAAPPAGDRARHLARPRVPRSHRRSRSGTSIRARYGATQATTAPSSSPGSSSRSSRTPPPRPMRGQPHTCRASSTVSGPRRPRHARRRAG